MTTPPHSERDDCSVEGYELVRHGRNDGLRSVTWDRTHGYGHRDNDTRPGRPIDRLILAIRGVALVH